MQLDFTTTELSLMADANILLSKRQVQNKIFRLLEEVQAGLCRLIENTEAPLPNNLTAFSGKISRGENYRGLPYLILDYPAIFSKENIFAYRTMFYWGNFFSATLHLQGSYLQTYRQALYDNADTLIGAETYISTGSTPWHYGYGKDNYTLLSPGNKSKILDDPFVKLSKKINLEEWQKLPAISTSFLQTLLRCIGQPPKPF